MKPHNRARRALILVASAALAALFALPAAAAFACASPPQIFERLNKPNPEIINATRAHIETEAVVSNSELTAPEATWRGEYAPAEANGEAPPTPKKPGESPWVLSNEKTNFGTIGAGGEGFKADFEPFLGTNDNVLRETLLHHLSPATKYAVRFVVEDACGTAEYGPSSKPAPTFTTLQAAAPEIARVQEIAKGQGGTTSFKFSSGAFTSTSAGFTANIENNGAKNGTEYNFEYSTSEAGPWAAFTSGATGTVSAAEDYGNPEARLTGLTPETTYYVRVKAKNEFGVVEQAKYGGPGSSGELSSFATPPARPFVGEPKVRNVTGTSAHVSESGLEAHGLETEWRFEYAPSVIGPWSTVPGAEGTVSKQEAQEQDAGLGSSLGIEGELEGLSPGKSYYVRLFAENEAGEGEFCSGGSCELISKATRGVTSFETAGAPLATTFGTHGVHGESLRLIGSVDPRSALTSAEQVVTVEGAPTGGTFTLSFEGETTGQIPFDASAISVETALGALSKLSETIENKKIPNISVEGRAGGPYTIYFYRAALAGKAIALLSASASFTPSSGVAVATTQQGGVAYDSDYHFEYVSQKQFEAAGGEGGFAKAASTGVVALGAGGSAVTIGQDLPALIPGETYRYRTSATNDSPGDPVVHGEEQVLTVPATVESAGGEACPNQALRVGPSASLPDCRAYEQVTPVDKEGEQEIFKYEEGLKLGTYAVLGEDGDHLMLETPATHLGFGPGAGNSPYFFARDPGKGWSMSAGTPAAEGGLDEYLPQVSDPDYTQVGIEAGWHTLGGGNSASLEFKVGPPGGPYTTVATVPRAEAEGNGEGWIAASEDFSKLVLQVEDPKLVTPKTTTKTGNDLYEYSGGILRQVNVGVGTCGAKIVNGHEETGGSHQSGPHAVSNDGSRVFFEAVPGNSCSEPENLYERVNGVETVDLGAYRFAAADAEGAEVLLEKRNGENPGLYLYRSGSAAKFLASSGPAAGTNFTVSEDLDAVYFTAGEDIYRYDVPSETLTFVFQAYQEGFRSEVSRDGRYYYFASRSTPGLPGGAIVPGGGREREHKFIGEGPTRQVYRYDSVEHAIECISCASAFDPEPRLDSTFSGSAASDAHQTGSPRLVFASSDGRFAFFQTSAALVKEDVDGEVIPEGTPGAGANEPENAEDENSVSGDVYEWREDGVDGCGHVQGCLALITNGRGGYLNELIGTAEEGNDVFIYTSSQLVKQDSDTAGDIYDVRVDGGFAEPSHPVECAGDSCSTPFAAPSDLTPSSATFQGAGNQLQPPPSKPAVKPKKKPKKSKKGKSHKAKRRAKKSQKAKKSSGRGK